MNESSGFRLSDLLLDYGVPILAGVAAAATPGLARGLAGATNTVGAIAALREQRRQQQAMDELGRSIPGTFDQPVTPAVPGEIQRQGAMAEPESAGIPAPMTLGTPALRLRDIIPDAQRSMITSLARVSPIEV